MERFSSSAAFHHITLKDRSDNIKNSLKRVEKFGYNPNKYVISDYSPWEFKPSNLKKEYDGIKDNEKVKRSSWEFKVNDSGSGQDLKTYERLESKKSINNLHKEYDLMMTRGGNRSVRR